MHRTVKILHSERLYAEVNGKRKIVALQERRMAYRQKKSWARKTNLTRLCRLSIGVLSDDFATVDVREDLCYHSRPEKAKFGDAFIYAEHTPRCRINFLFIKVIKKAYKHCLYWKTIL